jgi:hypothetical protein
LDRGVIIDHGTIFAGSLWQSTDNVLDLLLVT